MFEQALASDERAGLVIYGRAEVGKTRLADECAAQAAATGFRTERMVGSRTTSLLPLGAVAGLLAGGMGRPGPDGQVHMVTLFEETRRALAGRHEGRRLVTIADDITLFDDVSLALLGHLAERKTIFLIATVRAGEPVPDLVTGMWRDGRLDRIDLNDLTRMHFDTLLHLALGGPSEAGAGREFWEITGGNPLYARVAESWLLHDLMRICRQDTSVRLGELAELCDSPLVAARARHAVAVRTRDPAELDRVADDFEALGAMLLAAEAATNSGEAFSQKGDQRKSAAASRRSSELIERCEDAATPGLIRTGSAVPLSGREREIAMLAAAGLASKDIADRLFLSVRTVNNHLQHVYTKLGVSSRAGLAEALGGSS
ncbi:MAG TPA: LuxR C-terminal-related transcriptional regulator [Streptosporangiaceae bacterium]